MSNKQTPTTSADRPNAAFLRAVPGGVELAVKLQPRASRNEIGEAIGNELKIKVTAPPVDSAANEALLRLLAEKLGVPRGAVQLVRGQTSRHKTVRIAGVSVDDAAKHLITKVGSTDKEEVMLKGGHVSLVAGPNALRRLWPKLDSWLGGRSI